MHLSVEAAASGAGRPPGGGGRDRAPGRPWREASWSSGAFRRTGGVRGGAAKTRHLALFASAPQGARDESSARASGAEKMFPSAPQG